MGSRSCYFAAALFYNSIFRVSKWFFLQTSAHLKTCAYVRCQHVADRLLRTDFTSQLPRRLQTATPTDRQIPIICTDRRGCVLSKETITFSSPQETELGRAPNRVRLSVCGSRLNGFPVTGLVRRLCISVSSSFCLVELTYFDCRHIIRTLSNLLELT